MITCKNCGNVFDEKYDVCPYCGTAIMHNEAQNPYTYNMPAQMFMSQSSNIAAKKKSNIKLISIISASCLVLIGIIIALIMIFSQPNTQSQLSEQISLGEKYLTEENYEEAIVAFKKAIEIESNDPELYIKLADAYMANGDSDNAIATLENGYKQTNDEAIKKKLDEFKTQLEYDKLISDGEKAFSDKNYTEAVKKFEKAIELKPTEVKPYISAADCYVNSKDNDSAKKILEKGYEKTKSNDIKKKLDELKKQMNTRISYTKKSDEFNYKKENGNWNYNGKADWVVFDNPNHKKGITTINNIIDEAVKSVLSMKEDYKDISEYDYSNYDYKNNAFIQNSLITTVRYNKNNIISISNFSHIFKQSSVHGYPSRKSYTINAETGEQYKLTDIYSGGSDGFYESIKKKYKEKYKDAIQSKLDNETIDTVQFYLSDDSLVLYFNVYQISYYAASFCDLEIPYSEKNLFKFEIEEDPESKQND